MINPINVVNVEEILLGLNKRILRSSWEGLLHREEMWERNNQLNQD